MSKPDGSKLKRVTGVICVLDDFDRSAFAAFEVYVLQRADPEMRSAKCTTLCRALPYWLEPFPYHTEIHWVNTLSMAPE